MAELDLLEAQLEQRRKKLSTLKLKAAAQASAPGRAASSASPLSGTATALAARGSKPEKAGGNAMDNDAAFPDTTGSEAGRNVSELRGMQYDCANCHNGFYKSGVRISNEKNPEQDWEGKIWCLCKACYEENHPEKATTDKKWRATCTKLWKARKTALEGRNLVLKRTRTWQDVIGKIAPKGNDESRSAFRARILLSHYKQMADNFASTLDEESQEQCVKRAESFREWQEHIKRQAEDNTYVPQVDLPILSNNVAQYASQLWKGTDDFFLCRHRDCLLVARNTDWLPNEGGGVFSCPACLRRYHPWMGKPGYVNANKVWVVKLKNLEGGSGVRNIDNTHTTETGEAYAFLPAYWRSSVHQDLENKMKRITLQIDEDLASMPDMEKLAFVISKVKQLPVPGFFQLYHFTKDKVDAVDMKNAEEREKWDYKHLLDEGFYAVHLHDATTLAEEGALAPNIKDKLITCNLDTPDEEDDLIYLYAYLRVLAEARVTAPGPAASSVSPSSAMG